MQTRVLHNFTAILGSIMVAMFLLVFAMPASAQVVNSPGLCATQNSNGSIQCSASYWCGGTCQAMPVGSLPKTATNCGNCANVCPTTQPNDCTGTNNGCQASNGACGVVFRTQQCDPGVGATSYGTQICGDCQGGYMDCDASAAYDCRAMSDPSCPAPKVYNPCNATCVDPYILDAALVPPIGTIPQLADVDIDGQITVTGDMFANDVCWGPGGVFCLSRGEGGGAWSTTPDGDIEWPYGQIGVGLNPDTGETGPQYPIDIFANGDIDGVGDTAILRLVDASDGTAFPSPIWTGVSLARYDNAGDAINEKWFMGMDNSASDSYLLRSGGSNYMSLNLDGSTSIGKDADVGIDGVSIGENAGRAEDERSISIGKNAGWHNGDTVRNRDAIAIGDSAMGWTGSGGEQSIAIGGRSLMFTGGYDNVAVGHEAMIGNADNASASDSVGIGSYALGGVTSGSRNVAVGREALSDTSTGNENVAAGYVALDYLSTGSGNVAYGTRAGTGWLANDRTTTGVNNTFIGYGARQDAAAQVSYATAIGQGAKVSVNDGVVLGNENAYVGIRTTSPAYPLDLSSTDEVAMMRIRDGSGSSALWTGTALSRDISEQWFIGMPANGFVDPDFDFTYDNELAIRYDGATTAMVVDKDGKVTADQICVNDGAGGTSCLGGAVPSGDSACFGPFVRGFTPLTYDGARGGYFTAHNLCDAAFPETGAHVCSVNEILNSIQCNQGEVDNAVNNGKQAWIVNGPPGFTAPAQDCGGFTSNASNNLGRIWNFDAPTGGKGYLSTCNQTSFQFACCW